MCVAFVVCVCVCICIYVYIYIYIYICLFIYLFIYICVCMWWLVHILGILHSQCQEFQLSSNRSHVNAALHFYEEVCRSLGVTDSSTGAGMRYRMIVNSYTGDLALCLNAKCRVIQGIVVYQIRMCISFGVEDSGCNSEVVFE